MRNVVKILVILSIMVIGTLVQVTGVKANSGPPVIGLEIGAFPCHDIENDMLNTETEFDGNLDILVRTEDFDHDFFGEMTIQYKEVYPFYEDVNYLNEIEDGWTSFSAYAVNQNWGFDHYQDCGIQFGDDSTVKKMEYIKIVYFDDNGDTLFISEEIEIPNVLFYHARDAHIYFNTDTYNYDTYLEPTFNSYIFFSLIVIGLFVLYSVAIELIMAFVFNLRTKKVLLHILLINIVTQVIMYVYFLGIFDSFQEDYYRQLYIYEVIVLFIEFGYLYWRFKPTVSAKRLAAYVLISNVVSYLVGLIRHY